MDWEYAGKLAGGGIAGIITMCLAFQQVLKRWKGNDAEISVMELLHSELERMGAQNKILSEYVNKLQLEVNKNNIQLAELQIENKKLNAEVTCLTLEIVKLRSALPSIKD